MKEGNQQLLYNNFPKLFRQKDMSKQYTLMCWGIKCGDGWFTILQMLCSQIQTYVNRKKCKQPEFVQIKEKFGTLDISIDYSDDYVNGLVDMTKTISKNVCECCGTTENVRLRKGSWISTLCVKCYKK